MLWQHGPPTAWLVAAGTGKGKPLAKAGAGAQPCRVIELRTLTPADWRIWRKLRLAALAEAPGAFGSRLADWQDAGEERWQQRLAIPGSVNFIALLDGEPAGMVSGVPGEDATPELISLWVSPAARGKGIGDRLVQAVAQWARRRDAAALRLAVAEDNDKAVALYRRHGFADTGEREGPLPDSAGREMVMIKQLQSADTVP